MLNGNAQKDSIPYKWLESGTLKQLNCLFGDAYVQCPDPHFKKRHHKRRVVQKPLADSIATSLMPGPGRYNILYDFILFLNVTSLCGACLCIRC